MLFLAVAVEKKKKAEAKLSVISGAGNKKRCIYTKHLNVYILSPETRRSLCYARLTHLSLYRDHTDAHTLSLRRMVKQHVPQKDADV